MNSFDKVSFAIALHNHRLESGLSIREVSEQLGVSIAMLSRMENALSEPGAAAYATIIGWLKRDAQDFLLSEAK